jgi:sugar lactone lactonase YvrE
MKRLTITAALLLAAGAAQAQDMPLADILIDGEGWKPAEKSSAPPLTAAKALKVRGSHLVRAEDLKAAGLVEPSGMVLWPDGGTLVVADAGGKHLWAFRLDKDGKPVDGDRYYPLRVRPGEKASRVRGLAVDQAGRVYACTPQGVQVFDPTGRLSGVMLKPCDGELTAAAFGGAAGDTLFVLCGNQVFARKTRAKGVSK